MRPALALAACGVAAWLLLVRPPAPKLVELPAGVVELSRPLEIAGGTEVRGAPSGTLLRAASDFRGAALLLCRAARDVRLRGFAVDGNRAALETRAGLPPSNITFARFTPANGILAESVERLRIEDVRFTGVAGFAILASACRDVAIERVEIADSGSRNAAGRNNATGGILLEDGTARFRVTGCALRNVRGNGIWTHSRYTAPRNRDGLIADNRFDTLARDAIQVGHALRVRVERNRGARIGYPVEAVDVEGGAIAVALDTAGNVEAARYAGNRFEEINGQCIDLDGFHHGQVRGNVCVNRGRAEDYPLGGYAIAMNNHNPDMRPEGVAIVDNQVDGARYGGIFVIGSRNVVAGNRMRRLNLARCNESGARFACSYYAGRDPDLLRSGIYLGRGPSRPAPMRDNEIRDNRISGFGMRRYCVVAAPGVSLQHNRVERNVCLDE